MSVIGYARVSTTGQSLDIQREQLLAAGCERVFEEKMSGTTTEGRELLEEALRYVREGDVFTVCRLDRLARSMIDLRKIVDGLTAKNVGFRVLQQGAIDTTRSDGRLLLNILASFAEFETDIRKERQADGIEKAKSKGVYTGRKRSISAATIAVLRDAGLGPTAIAKRLGIGRASVYRLMAEGASKTSGDLRAGPEPVEA